MPGRFHIHLDAAGGAAGDMFVAALLAALPELRDRVFADLAAAMPDGVGRPTLDAGTSGDVAACRFFLAGAPEAHRHDHDHHHHHDHDHDHHHHDHDHHHHAEVRERGPVRFPEIARMIGDAALHPGTAAQAIAILRRLAEVESRMHRVPLDEVHFHEIADWDSLMDVVAAGSIAAALDGCTWSVSDLPLGGGLVRTGHGLLPVPAPATAELLKGFSWRDDGVGGERVTPTGGAIIAHLVAAGSEARRGGALRAVGNGAGTRELPGMPNILRALVFEATPDADLPGEADAVIVVGFEVDDMTGEEIGVAADRLRAAAGVFDLSIGARQGKKGRPASDFRLLVKPECLAAVGALCFAETSTIGLRWRREQRRCLPRDGETVTVDGLELRTKRSLRPDGAASVKVESDDVAVLDGLARRRRIARQGEREGER
jgi:pyridinium-3,5-bisthiocarboxylic acid mononucleotide nickel chelatase